MYQGYSPQSVQKPLPTMFDLPSEDPKELGLPDEFHVFQPQLLRETCQPATHTADAIFIGTDLNLYYDSRYPGWYKRPDWFLVLGVPKAKQQQDLRWSYVVWQEGVNPFLVVELLSPGTEDEDLGRGPRKLEHPPSKWDVYERILRIPYYAIFDRYDNSFRLFQLQGMQYQPLDLTEQRYWFTELGIGLGLWAGNFQETQGLWLRWHDTQNNWIATTAEKLEHESERSERLAARLRALGIDPDQV
jgi:Uma2 family endonuclease